MIGYFQSQINRAAAFQRCFNLDSIKNLGKMTALKFNVNYSTCNADNASFSLIRFPPTRSPLAVNDDRKSGLFMTWPHIRKVLN